MLSRGQPLHHMAASTPSTTVNGVKSHVAGSAFYYCYRLRCTIGRSTSLGKRQKVSAHHRNPDRAKRITMSQVGYSFVLLLHTVARSDFTPSTAINQVEKHAAGTASTQSRRKLNQSQSPKHAISGRTLQRQLTPQHRSLLGGTDHHVPETQ